MKVYKKAWLVKWEFPGEDWWFPVLNFKGLWCNEGDSFKCLILAKDAESAKDAVRKAHYHDHPDHGDPPEVLHGCKVSDWGSRNPMSDSGLGEAIKRGAVWDFDWSQRQAEKLREHQKMLRDFMASQKGFSLLEGRKHAWRSKNNWGPSVFAEIDKFCMRVRVWGEVSARSHSSLVDMYMGIQDAVKVASQLESSLVKAGLMSPSERRWLGNE